MIIWTFRNNSWTKWWCHHQCWICRYWVLARISDVDIARTNVSDLDHLISTFIEQDLIKSMKQIFGWVNISFVMLHCRIDNHLLVRIPKPLSPKTPTHPKQTNPRYKGYCRPANKTFILQPDDPRRQSYYPDYEVLMMSARMTVLMMNIMVEKGRCTLS